ncbi:MAG: oxygen-insensitive NADPH nitroreductase [Pantoea sp. Brub]|nr:oxygen-insensitive NADPH nitroreductase [Pantoea sp. Brub]
MTKTINIICNHRSIRKFTNKNITDNQIKKIIHAAKSASTSSFLQCSSIIRITDKFLRVQLESFAGNQSWISQSAEFWIFCADFNRHIQICPNAKLGSIEQLIIGCIDTSLMAQNAIIAAESMNLGGVFIGGIRNNISDVIKLLKIPKFVLPLFGFCLGYPKYIPNIKPRIPQSMLLHENYYKPVDKSILTVYDNHIIEYYKHRDSNQRNESWSQLIQRLIIKEMRPFMISYLRKQGWAIF